MRKERFGRISNFDPAGDDWLAYTEHLEKYLAAKDITEADRKRAILLSSVGTTTYKLIRILITPDARNFSSWYRSIRPKPSIIVERFKFNSRNKQTGETIAAYVCRGSIQLLTLIVDSTSTKDCHSECPQHLLYFRRQWRIYYRE